MTELEYEKACRGPVYPVTNEYAWGNQTLIQLTGFVGTLGSGTETALPIDANSRWGASLGKSIPARCGMFATATSSRTVAGASYWGIMEMSGNVAEKPVMVGHATGRGFTGTHGNGTLTSAGLADVPSWPAAAGTGTGTRGSFFGAGNGISLRVSPRANDYTASRGYTYGMRAVRSDPVVNP